MAYRTTRHKKQRRVMLTDFSGGINVAKPAVSLREDELQAANNYEFDHVSGVLKTRDGLILITDTGYTIEEVFYDNRSGAFLFSAWDAGVHNLYKWDGASVTLVGALTGSKTPVFTLWDTGDVLIASGGKLQVYNTATGLTTISASPDAFIVFTRYGRVGVAKTDSDEIWFSGVGDKDMWDSTDPTNPAIYQQIGYKDGGTIVAVVPLSKDLIIFKSTRHCYRLVDWYPNWQVYEVGREVGCLNHKAAVQLYNDVYFLDIYGLRSLATVMEYGDVKSFDIDQKVNRVLKSVLQDTARIIVNPLKAQLYILAEPPSSYVWVYHPVFKAFTTFEFSEELQCGVDVDDLFYMGLGTKLMKFSNSATDDDGVVFQSTLTTARTVSADYYLLKRLLLGLSLESDISGSITAAGVTFPLDIASSSQEAYAALGYAYDATEYAYQIDEYDFSKRLVARAKEIDITLALQGRAYINYLGLEMAEVN